MSELERLEQLYLSLDLELPERVYWVDSPAQALLTLANLPDCGVDVRLFERLMGPYLEFERATETVFPEPSWNSLVEGRRCQSRSHLVREGLESFRRHCTSSQDMDPKWLETWQRTVHLPLDPALWESFARKNPSWNESFHFNPKTILGEGGFVLYAPTCLDFDELGEHLYCLRKLHSSKLPTWLPQLRQLAQVAGWLWPRQGAVVVSRKPTHSSFVRDLPESRDGPALTWSDGWELWARAGKWISARAAQSPSSLRPEDIEGDLEQQRRLLKLRGPSLLNAPHWPTRLRNLAKMVFERQYIRFDESHLSSAWQPWPESEPQPQHTFYQGQGLPNGSYASFYEDGQLRTVGVASGGALSWLWLDYQRAEGWFQSGPCAEKYFPDGRVEDFSPWDDSSDPYPVIKTFEAWTLSFLRRLGA